MFSLFMLVFYFKKENYPPNSKISELMLSLPNHVQLNEQVKILFIKNKEFTLRHLLGIYEYIEEINYSIIEKHINNDYLAPLDEKFIDSIENIYLKEIRFVTKSILARGIRKFISRTLSGKRMDDEIDPKKELIMYLQYNEDIWEPEVFNNEQFDNDMTELSSIPITVSQIVSLHNFLIGKK